MGWGLPSEKLGQDTVILFDLAPGIDLGLKGPVQFIQFCCSFTDSILKSPVEIIHILLFSLQQPGVEKILPDKVLCGMTGQHPDKIRTDKKEVIVDENLRRFIND